MNNNNNHEGLIEENEDRIIYGKVIYNREGNWEDTLRLKKTYLKRFQVQEEVKQEST